MDHVVSAVTPPDAAADALLALQAALAELSEVIHANWVVSAMTIGWTALLLADYFHTLPDEIAYMWPASMSLTKVLFFLVRYFPLAHTAVTVKFYHFGELNMGGEDCNVSYYTHAWATIVVFWICNAIVFLRVYAFSGQNRRLLCFLVPWYIGLRVAEGYLVHKFSQSIEFLPFPEPTRLGCIAVGGSTRFLSLVFVCVLLSLGSATAIMIFIAWQKRNGVRATRGPASIFHIFVRDGIIYFICLSCIAVINICFELSAPKNGIQYATNQLQVHADAILTGRMLMHLRSSAQKDLVFSRSGIYKYPGTTLSRSGERPGQSLTDIRFYASELSSTAYGGATMTTYNLSEQTMGTGTGTETETELKKMVSEGDADSVRV